MNNKTIVMYEISQKQHFIFRTNKLIENIGASHIIRELTTDPRNLFTNLSLNKYINEEIDLPEPRYRIVGGGNASFIFEDKDEATTFSRNLSAFILRYFPSIELFLIQKEINWNKELLFTKDGIINKMRNELATKKNERRYAVKQESWGIQQVCATSGLPANTLLLNSDKELEPRAEEFKYIQAIGRNVRNDEYTDRFITKNYNLTSVEKLSFFKQDDIEVIFDKASETDGKSYLAIISLDGNAMGLKVGKFFEQDFSCNDDFIHKYKKFTEQIDDAYTKAFQKTISYVMEKYDIWAPDFYGDDQENHIKWKYVIPIRPIIASGDDVCFITYGKLGIEIAKTFLQNLQNETIHIGEKDNITTYRFEACAGVAIIRHRYPFWLGFQLADELCNNAKKRLKQDEKYWMELDMKDDGLPYDTSLIDWHIVSHADMVQDIESYREEFYTNKDGSKLTMRPYYIQHKSAKKKHFASYEAGFKRFALNNIQRTKENDKKQVRDDKIPSMAKWKALREVYHEGELAVNQWKILNQFSPTGGKETDDLFWHYHDGFGLVKDEQYKDQNKKGQGFATYYDAIEIFDYFTDLSGRNEK